MLTKTFIAAALTLSCAAVAAHAGPNPGPFNGRFTDPQTVTMNVSVSDLDLDRADGAVVALRRLRQAAQTICGPAPDKRALEASATYRACVRSALDQAVAAANIPQITALHVPVEPTQPARLASAARP